MVVVMLPLVELRTLCQFDPFSTSRVKAGVYLPLVASTLDSMAIDRQLASLIAENGP